MDTYRDLFQGHNLSGFATPQATRSFFETDATSDQNRLHTMAGKTGLTVSRLGFGTYRLRRGSREHFDALREALLSGVNVIDTAAHYGDGQSEFVVGRVLKELVDAKRVEREQIVLISKLGYLQGEALREYRNGDISYSNVVEHSRTRAHCLSPDFLEAQFERTLRRLGVECLDVLLLSNPELLQSPEDEQSIAAKLEPAFAFLEELRRQGRITAYGISSNALTRPASDSSALSLSEDIVPIAPNMGVVEFPANLLENDFRFSRLNAGGNLSEYINSRELWSLSNRPFYASHHDLGLVRLTRLVDPPPDDGLSQMAEFNRLLNALEEVESRVIDAFADRRFRFDERAPAPSGIIRRYQESFLTVEAFHRFLPGMVAAEFQKTTNQLLVLARNERQHYTLEALALRANGAISAWEDYIAVKHHRRMEMVESRLARAAPSLADVPLAGQALLFLLGGKVPDTVLVGMRRVAYVRQLTGILAHELPPPGELLPMATACEDAIDEALQASDVQGTSAETGPASFVPEV